MGNKFSKKPKRDPHEDVCKPSNYAELLADGRLNAKVLIMGAHLGGKSAIFKQLRALSDIDTDSRHDLERSILKRNVLSTIYDLMERLTKSGAEVDPNMNQLITSIKQWKTADKEEYTIIDLPIVKQFISHPSIQSILKNEMVHSLHCNADYYLANVEDWCNESYKVSHKDRIYYKYPTTGIVEYQSEYPPNNGESLRYSFFDIGGQRSERRKWIHTFENVTAVLFVVSLVGINKGLFEDGSTLRIKEDLALFEEIVNSRWFTNTQIILVLNKVDLLQRVLALNNGIFDICHLDSPNNPSSVDDLKHCSVDEGIVYITEQFWQRCRNEKREQYTEIISAVADVTDGSVSGEYAINAVSLECQTMVMEARLRQWNKEYCGKRLPHDLHSVIFMYLATVQHNSVKDLMAQLHPICETQKLKQSTQSGGLV